MDQPNYVPTLRLLGPLFLSVAWAIEFIAATVLLLSQGQFPRANKHLVVLAIAILATLHKVIYRQQNCDCTGSVPTIPQIWLIVVLIASYVGIALWLFWDLLF